MTLLVDALAYRERGWSIVPTKGKKPALRAWKRYADSPASEKTVRRWFAGDRAEGVAAICGPVSGNLVCRDFDAAGAYEAWAQQFPSVAATLPTVQTARGHHVWFRCEHERIIDLGDGELRGNGIALLPHSRHPSGCIYDWVIPLPSGALPAIDVHACGLAGRLTEHTEHTEHSEAMGGGVLASINPETLAAIESAINDNLPRRTGERNRRIFDFARRLKAIFDLTEMRVQDLKPIARQWWERALPRIGTKQWEETWLDFITAWGRIRFANSAEVEFQRMMTMPLTGLPAVAQEYDNNKLLRLVVICRELQRVAGDDPFYLACRKAGELVGVDHDTASRWLRVLVADEVLAIARKGHAGNPRATRFRYIADDVSHNSQ